MIPCRTDIQGIKAWSLSKVCRHFIISHFLSFLIFIPTYSHFLPRHKDWMMMIQISLMGKQLSRFVSWQVHDSFCWCSICHNVKHIFFVIILSHIFITKVNKASLGWILNGWSSTIYLCFSSNVIWLVLEWMEQFVKKCLILFWNHVSRIEWAMK